MPPAPERNAFSAPIPAAPQKAGEEGICCEGQEEQEEENEDQEEQGQISVRHGTPSKLSTSRRE